MKTKLKFVGVYCSDCGRVAEPCLGYEGPSTKSWMGDIKVFRCAPCRLDYVLFFGYRGEFITLYAEESTENFLAKAGSWVYDDGDIPF